jgi:hypothetical protein
MLKKPILLSLTLAVVMLTPVLMVYAEDLSPDTVDLLGLTEEGFDEVYERLLNDAEEDTSRPKWLIRTWGYSWKLEPPTVDSASQDIHYRMSMKLVATRVYVTKDGYKLYRLKGTIIHDGKSVEVYGVAILDKDGCFCMKLDADESLGFRLFGCGRIRPENGHVRLWMRGRFELCNSHYGFLQRGYAIRINVTSLAEI